MSQRAKTFAPKAQVLIHKNIVRDTTDGKTPVSPRYKGIQKTIDITPFLGEGDFIRTTKSVREPAGAFVVSVSAKPDKKDMDHLYGLLEPMDCVEIRFSHEPHKSTGKLPIIMRGFISDIRIAESIEGGRPVRRVTISGQDYGKIWQIMQIHYFKNYTLGENLLTSFKFFAKYGEAINVMNVGEFVTTVVEKVINDFLEKMGAREGGPTSGNTSGNNTQTSSQQGQSQNSETSTSPILKLKTDIQTKEGVVSPTGINSFEGGTVYALLSQHGDIGAWNELFIEDRDDGPYVVYRPNPFKSLDGKMVMDVKMPEVIEVSGGDIAAQSAGRTDANVANYFWVDSPRFEIVHGSIHRIVAAQGDTESFFLQKHKNSDPALYGIRKMHEVTQQGGPDNNHHGNGLPEGELKTEMNLSADWITKRRMQLMGQNKDNVMLETGSVTVRGNEKIKPGVYIKLTRGTIVSECYAVTVDHEFVPFSHFKTTFSFERGTGFAERTKLGGGGDAPYLAEMVIKNG